MDPKSCLTVKEGQRFRTIKAQSHKFLNSDIKDLYINLPTRDIIHSKKYLLTNRSIPHNRAKQFTDPFQTVFYRNYFCHYEKYYQTSKGVAVGAPISSVTLEIFLHYYEQQITKH